MNREKEDLEGCPVCGESTVYAKFFFLAEASIWFVINLPIKIVSADNCVQYYKKRFKNTGTSYSLGQSYRTDSDAVTLIFLK